MRHSPRPHMCGRAERHMCRSEDVPHVARLGTYMYVPTGRRMRRPEQHRYPSPNSRAAAEGSPLS